MSDPFEGSRAAAHTSLAVLNLDAAQIGAELVRLDGGTDPFAAAVRASSIPTVIADARLPDRPLVFANDAFCLLTGYAREEVLGRNCRFLQGPTTDPAAVTRIRNAVAAAQPLEIDLRNYRKNGEPFWNRLILAPVRDATGALAYYLASQVDVTLERERMVGLENRNAVLVAELADRLEAQHESEARFRDMADNISQLAWMADPDGSIFWYNRRWCDYTGLTVEQMQGVGWIDAQHPEHIERVTAGFHTAIAAGLPWEDTFPLRSSDGGYRWFLSRAQPIRDPGGRIMRWFGTNTDITEQREAEASLEARVAERTAALTQAISALHEEVLEREQAEEKLRQAQKMEAVGQLTGGIAHDFNNMLQAIGGSLELMRRRVAQGRPGEIGRFVEAAEQVVSRATGLTHRLLAFARRQTLQPRATNLDELIKGIADLIRRTVGQAIAVELRLADGVWPVLCDANQLESALLNLAINARDAMPTGGRLVIRTVMLRLSPADVAGHEGAAPGDYVEISIADTGTGMDEVTRARAFEPFFTTKPLGQGTGLGLSQLYGFVRQTGGMVRLESALGQGTMVCLYLPRDTEVAEAEDTHRNIAQSPSGVPRGTHGTVLVVEDEDAVRAVVAEALREQGCRVLEAGDGSAGLHMLNSRERIDLLVTDVGLPGLNGRQLAAARVRRPGLPVLLITGYAGGAVEEALPAGMEVIGKPFALDALASRVHAMVSETPVKAVAPREAAEKSPIVTE